MRLVISLGAAIVAADVGCLASAQEPRSDSAAKLMDDLMWGRGPVGGPFELVDHAGRQRTDADFRGTWLLIYFGFTYCPGVCPTDLLEMALAIDQLGKAGEGVQPLFITVDPARDTAEHLAHYVGSFHPRLIGLTGTPEQIQRVARAYKVYYAKSPADSPDYVVDHSSFIYLVDPTGRYVGFFPPGTAAVRMVEMIQPRLLPLVSE